MAVLVANGTKNREVAVASFSAPMPSSTTSGRYCAREGSGLVRSLASAFASAHLSTAGPNSRDAEPTRLPPRRLCRSAAGVTLLALIPPATVVTQSSSAARLATATRWTVALWLFRSRRELLVTVEDR